MIELRNVTKEYSKGHAALNGVSVKIERENLYSSLVTVDQVSLH